MDIVTLDFETYYGDDYTLSSKKITTEGYVRDPRFETILCSFKINGGTAWWVPRDDVGRQIRDLHLGRRAVLAHHAHFDGLILSYHYGVSPGAWLDTLGMARALHGANGRLSLAKLCERYGIGAKGDEVLHAKGLRFADFPADQLERYGQYSCNDTDRTYDLGLRMVPQFSRSELQIYDQIVRMFTEPVLRLDVPMLEAYAENIRTEKMKLLMEAGVAIKDLMSNERFAQELIKRGIEPPMKISPTWLKKPPEERDRAKMLTYAFAKTDAAMQALQEHPDIEVQILVEARLKNKTTIAEKGAQRLIGMASRGPATVYLKVAGASGTHRLSGGDLFNWQSMKRGSDLRRAVQAYEGHLVVVVDSSTIEARLLDWLAGQEDMVQVYRRADDKTGPDMYCVIAERIYQRVIVKANDPAERQMGKVAKLGLGFGMGADKFIISVRGQAKDADGKPLQLTKEFGTKVVDIYREAHPQVRKLWKRGDAVLKAIAAGEIGVALDYRGIVTTCKDGLQMPDGLQILFPDLQYKVFSKQEREANNGYFDGEWTFWNGKAREHIYGSKLIENVIQCLARIIVFNQCLSAAKQARGIARWVHSVHDEGVFVVHAWYANWMLDLAMQCFRTPPAWAQTLPLNCEGGFHQRYGDAKQ